MKKILVLLIFLIFTRGVFALTLEGNVSYTVESARSITFENVRAELPLSMVQPHLIDESFGANKDYIKYGGQPVDRYIEVFKKGPFRLAYAIQYKKHKEITYYYLKMDGTLLFIDIEEVLNKAKNRYPLKFYRYDTKGKLIAGGIAVSENESFLFDKNQKLITHRKNNTGYNARGKEQWQAIEVKF